jgi:hypothetical protein
MQFPPFQFRQHPSLAHQTNPPTSDEQKAQAEEQSEVVENTAMWRAAANLTTAEYAYARWLKLRREKEANSVSS